jgi:O-antigen/teichoic acid export membrane protein
LIAKNFIKHTFIYGLATVLPRAMNFLLVPLHTQTLETIAYSDNTTFYVYAAFFNVLLTFGMETAFFRFFNQAQQPKKVFSTLLITLGVSTLLFFGMVIWNVSTLSSWFSIPELHLQFLIGVLVLDTLVVAPFAYLRAIQKSKKFAWIKLLNILVYAGLNVFFLWMLPTLGWDEIDIFSTQKVNYIFVANLAASIATFAMLFPLWFSVPLYFDRQLFAKMVRYGLPIMIAGLAFVVNENLDKLLLKKLINEDIMGAYSGCYKLAVFMTLFIQAFRLGAEPFFFKYASHNKAPQTYATILKYFVIVGSTVMLLIVVHIELLKTTLIRNESYWKAIEIVPIILLANLFLGIYHNLSIWYKLTDRTYFGMYISIFGAAITIVLNLWLIPQVGFIASAWATLAAYGCMMILSYLLGTKYYPVPYSVFRMGGYLTVATLLGGIHFYEFYANYVLGTVSVFVFLLGAILIERKELTRFLANK